MNLRNKWVMGVLGLGAAAMIGVSATAVYAQESTTSDAPAMGQLRFGRGGGENQEALAEALGITVEELQAAKDEVRANLLAEAVAAGEITQEEADLMEARWVLQEFLRDRMQTAYDDAIADAVTEGIITQEQADQLSSEGGGFFGPGMGGMGGGHHGGPRHGGPGGEGPNGEGRNGEGRGPRQAPGDAPAPEGETPEESSGPSIPAFNLNL